MPADIFTLIFENILKIRPDIISQYPTIQDQLIYLILIPHVIVFLFLFAFGVWIIKEHAGLRYLLIIAGYIFIIWSGWYGQILIPVFINWFMIILGAAFIFFLLSRIIHPARAMGFFKLAGEAGASIHDLTFGKMKKRKALEKEIQSLEAERRAYQLRVTDPRLTTRAKEAIQMNISDIDAKIARLKEEESKL